MIAVVLQHTVKLRKHRLSHILSEQATTGRFFLESLEKSLLTLQNINNILKYLLM